MDQLRVYCTTELDALLDQNMTGPYDTCFKPAVPGGSFRKLFLLPQCLAFLHSGRRWHQRHKHQVLGSGR